MDNFYLSVLVLRVSYLRCLIYKVHTASAGQAVFYHNLDALSRNFFRFFKLFHFLISCRPVSRDSFDRIPRLPWNVNPYFSFSFSFFEPPPFLPNSLLFMLPIPLGMTARLRHVKNTVQAFR